MAEKQKNIGLTKEILDWQSNEYGRTVNIFLDRVDTSQLLYDSLPQGCN